MKIEAEKLRAFLHKTSLNKQINTAVLNFDKEGLKVDVHAAQIVLVNGVLPKEQFMEYEEIGELGLKNLKVLVSLLSRYGTKLIQLKQEGNFLQLVSETGSVDYVLCDKEYVHNHFGQQFPIKLTEFVKIKADVLKDITKAGDMLNTKEVYLETKDKQLSLIVTSETGDKVKENISVDYSDAKGLYGADFIRVVDVIEGDVELGFMDNYPIIVKEKNKLLDITYIVAPIDLEEKNKAEVQEEPMPEDEAEEDN